MVAALADMAVASKATAPAARVTLVRIEAKVAKVCMNASYPN